MSIVVSERDKPFIIAIIMVVGLLAFIYLGAIGVLWNNAGIEDYVKEMSTALIAMVGTIVGFYFMKKNNNTVVK